jgi:hypothetical protein
MDQQPPAQDADKKVTVPEVGFAPKPRTVYEHPSAMTIRVYDFCPEHGVHTDPELQAFGYAEGGI